MPQTGNYNPSGSVVFPRYAVQVGEAVSPMSARFGIVVYVRMTAKGIRGFERFCAFNGVALESLDDFGHSFVAIGSPESLEALSGHPSVVRWHYCLNRAVSSSGAGAMPKK